MYGEYFLLCSAFLPPPMLISFSPLFPFSPFIFPGR